MATLDHICLEANWPWRTVEFQKETAGVAQNGTDLVPSPEWSCRSGTVLTYRLIMNTIMVSKCCHHFYVSLRVLYKQQTTMSQNEKTISNQGKRIKLTGM